MSSIVISLISGILLALAFPSANLHWLAWFALAPLMYCTYTLGWKRAAFAGAAFGFGFFSVLLYWIMVFGKLPWFALAAFQSLYIIGFVVTGKLIGGRLSLWGRFILLPALWVAFEWIRSLGMLGFTWGDLGYSQYKVGHIIRIAAITGVWGLSFLIAMSNAALSNLFAARKSRTGHQAAHAQVLLVILAVVGVLAYGQATRHMPKRDSLRVAVVQGNIEQGMTLDADYTDRTWKTYTAMTLKAAQEHPDLILWPETVVPGYAARDWWVKSRMEDLASKAGAGLLAGGWGKDDSGKVYNSVFMFAPGRGMLGEYSKVHLVPFGEYVPLRKYLPFLDAYHVTAHDTSPGEGFNVIRTDKCVVGTAICFESIFPEISRRLTKAGANILCVVTNDCWYDETPAAEQHMAFSVLRAVENRRWLVRGASTGISCVIAPDGRVVSKAEVGRVAVVQADASRRWDVTFYTKHGDWVVYTSLGLVLLMSASALARRVAKGEGNR